MKKEKEYVRSVLYKIFQGKSLSEEEAEDVLKLILSEELGAATDTALGALFASIMARGGPTENEVVGFLKTVLYYDRTDYFSKVSDAVGIVGSGKDDLKTFNISTGAAIVAAAAGAKIIKNGGRSESSVSGTSDVMEELGVNIHMDKETILKCLENLNLTFVEAGKYFPRMGKHYIGKIFFINPLSYILSIASSLDFGMIVFGLSSDDVLFTARTLKKLGYIPSFVVNGKDKTCKYNIDEVSVIGPTNVAEIKKNGTIERYTIWPEDLGLGFHKYEEIAQSATVQQNAIKLLKALNGRKGYGPTDIVAANAGFAIYLAGLVKDIREGVELALNVIEKKKAINLLKDFVSMSGGYIQKLQKYLTQVV